MATRQKRGEPRSVKREPRAPREQALLEPAPKGSLGDEAYEAIKWQILTMELAPGTFLNVQELSERLGLGRSPVHYAVHRLQHDGLLEVIQRKGILVRSWSPQAINHVVEARIPLEMAMVRLAAARATEEQLRGLKARLAEGKKLVTAKNRQGLMELDALALVDRRERERPDSDDEHHPLGLRAFLFQRHNARIRHLAHDADQI